MLALTTLGLGSKLSGGMRVKKRYHHGALREALISQALRVLEKDGLEGMSLRGLAASAGVSKTAPYRDFADKRELLVTLAAEGFRTLADRLEAALAEEAAPAEGAVSPDAAAGIRSLFRAYLDFARSRPALYRLMLSRLGYSLHSESCRINSMRAFNCLVRAVERARAQGWRAGQETMPLVLSLWAEVHGWAGLLIDGLLPENVSETGDSMQSLSESLLE